LIWKDLGFLKKSANKPTLEPFLSLYSGLVGIIFSPEGADFYGDYDYPIKAVFKKVSN
jgi:hypothetical protein